MRDSEYLKSYDFWEETLDVVAVSSVKQEVQLLCVVSLWGGNLAQKLARVVVTEKFVDFLFVRDCWWVTQDENKGFWICRGLLVSGPAKVRGLLGVTLTLLLERRFSFSFYVIFLLFLLFLIPENKTVSRRIRYSRRKRGYDGRNLEKFSSTSAQRCFALLRTGTKFGQNLLGDSHEK